MSELEARAARHGSGRVRLDTDKALEAAMRLYRDSGYSKVPAYNDGPYAHHWFEKRL
jgi:ribosomal protein S18 acetylase RimI-like enzyme